MHNWYTINLGDAMLAGEALSRIEARFDAAYAHAPDEAARAVFFRHHAEGGLHCTVHAYFSPAAARVAEAMGARPCPQPASDGLGLLAGPEQAWAVLFPE